MQLVEMRLEYEVQYGQSRHRSRRDRIKTLRLAGMGYYFKNISYLVYATI